MKKVLKTGRKSGFLCFRGLFFRAPMDNMSMETPSVANLAARFENNFRKEGLVCFAFKESLWILGMFGMVLA